MGIVVEVDRDVRRVGVAEHALQRAVGGLLDRGVDLVLRRRALGDELQVDDRDVRGRHAHGEAVELAVELRQHEADGLGGAGRGRDHRERCGARAVEILVHRVQRRLVAGVGMDRRHHAFLDADGFMQHLGEGREAVGRARRIRDDEVILGQLVVVDAVDDGEVGVFAGGRDQHALGAGGQVGGGLVAGGEDARAFQRDLDAEFLVGQLGRVALGGHLDRAAADVDRVAGDLHLMRELAVHRIVAEQVGVGLDRAEIVDGDDLDVRTAGFDDGAQNIAPDASETVDRDLHSHFPVPFPDLFLMAASISQGRPFVMQRRQAIRLNAA